MRNRSVHPLFRGLLNAFTPAVPAVNAPLRINHTVHLMVAIEDVQALLYFEYHYTPGSPGIRTFRNGDPGYPPDPPEVDVISITRDGAAVPHWLFEALAESEALTNRLVDRHEDMLRRTRSYGP